MHSSFPGLCSQSFCPNLSRSLFPFSPSGILPFFHHSFLNSIWPLAYCLLIWLIQNTNQRRLCHGSIKDSARRKCADGLFVVWLSLSHGSRAKTQRAPRPPSIINSKHTNTPFTDMRLTRKLTRSVNGGGFEKSVTLLRIARGWLFSEEWIKINISEVTAWMDDSHSLKNHKPAGSLHMESVCMQHWNVQLFLLGMIQYCRSTKEILGSVEA